MIRPSPAVLWRIAKVAGVVCAALLAAAPAHALVIDAGFASSITGAADASTIEHAIDTAVGAIGRLYSNPGSVSILFTTAPGGFLGESEDALGGLSYADYTALLAADAAAHPTNTTLASAVANLAYGNDANGARPIAATTALLRVGLDLPGVTPCFDAGGNFVSNCGQTYDGVIVLSSTQPMSYTRPVGTAYDALRVIEHEVDEVLGGGGAGSTLNAIADDGLDDSRGVLTYYDGPLDLDRYSAAHVPSFTTSPGAQAYLSVDGGVTEIVGLNQNSGGDFGDFLSNGCIAYVQQAFTCPGQVANETAAAPEYEMLEAIGYDPVPEPDSVALLGIAAAILGLARRRRAPGAATRSWIAIDL